jgi:anti-sigma factor RsiW
MIFQRERRMNCSDVQYLMPLYLSGELDSASMAQFDRHAGECPACSRQMEEQQELDRGLRMALLSEAVDTTALRTRVLADIKREHSLVTAKTTRYPIRIAFAVAAVLLIMIVLSAAHRDNARCEQASADHVDEVVMARPRAWRTEDSSIEQLIAQRIAARPQLEQLAIPGFKLLRGKECGIAKSRYIHLVYGNGSQQISMYLLAGSDAGLLRRISTSLLPLVQSRSESGYNVTEGDANGSRILLVGTLSQSEEQVIVKNMLKTLS